MIMLSFFQFVIVFIVFKLQCEKVGRLQKEVLWHRLIWHDLFHSRTFFTLCGQGTGTVKCVQNAYHRITCEILFHWDYLARILVNVNCPATCSGNICLAVGSLPLQGTGPLICTLCSCFLGHGSRGSDSDWANGQQTYITSAFADRILCK